MQTVLIIGASRGLGFEFARQYAEAGDKVIATVRRERDVAPVAALGVKVLKYDSVKSPASTLSRAAANADIVIYNAGALAGGSVGEKQTQADFDKVMRTNVLGAMHVIPSIAPKLAKRNGKFVFISSTMGSMTLMSNGGRVIYRASKAALNAVVRAASLEFGPAGLTAIVFHPGWVKTDMGGKNADIDPETSIAGMRKTIAGLKPSDNGSFLNYDGKALAW
jgi:NAD(P)-dependent dehydrogenase (short-subunit alcohol dehydrogenase family)